MNKTDQKVELLEVAVRDLADELGRSHGILMNLIVALRATELDNVQRLIVDSALHELQKNQKVFFAKYADEVGGAKPENN